MSHLIDEHVWSVARAQADEATQATVLAHVAACGRCAMHLQQVRDSVALLSLLPDAPQMPTSMAARVSARLAQQAAPSAWSRWLESFGSWRVAMAGAAAIVAMGVGVTLWREVPVPLVVRAPVLPPVPAPLPPAPLAAPPQRLVASLITARGVSVGGTVAAENQKVRAGSTLKTVPGGSAWLSLPDGSRAGLTGASEVVLKKVETGAVTLAVSQGSLAMVAPHREDRVLMVEAGEVTVVDLGTRFVVSHEGVRVVVAVEEGEVEVRTPHGTQVVRAGHAVAHENGLTRDIQWPVKPPSKAEAAPQGTRLADPEPEAPVAAARSPDGGDEWALPSALGEAQGTRFSLDGVEDQLRAVHKELAVTPGPERQRVAREVRELADAGDCVAALSRAEAFLTGPAAMERSIEREARRTVLVQKARCLVAQGKSMEAGFVQRQIRALGR